MHGTRKLLPRLAGFASLGFVLHGCSNESALPTRPDGVVPVPPSVQQIACRADVRMGTLRCAAPARTGADGPSLSVVLGGQGTYVELTSSNVAYDAGTGIFQADVTVQSRIGQAMGTPDGSTVTGIRLFFHTGPIVTSGAGTVTVANPSGYGTFTQVNQPYFEYPEILGWWAVSSALQWQWNVPAAVNAFEFTVLVDAEIPAEQGVLRWLRENPPAGQVGLWGTGGQFYAVPGDELGWKSIWHYDGTSWRIEPVPDLSNLNLVAISGSSLDDVFAVGDYGHILHFDGAAWTQQASLTSYNLHGVWAGSPTAAFAVGENGTILRYDGTGWSPQTSGTTEWLRGVWGSSPSDVFAVGNGGTILHYDGASWAPQASGTTDAVAAVWGTSSTNVYAVGLTGGSGGTGTLHYDGATWTKVSDGAGNAIWGSSASDVFVVGDGNGGRIYHFDGTGWTQQTTGVAIWLPISAVWGHGANDVYATGRSTILHYDGANWSDNLVQPAMNKVIGFSASDVIAVGPDGYIARFDGSKWTQQASGTTMDLLDVWGPSPNDVYAVGANGNGALVHYDGNNWTIQSSGTLADLYGVWGTSANDIFTVGDNGTIMHYNGASWSPQTSGTTNNLRGVGGTSSSNVFAGGVLGTMLHYDGTSWSPQAAPGAGNLGQSYEQFWAASPSDVYAVGAVGAPVITGPGLFHYDGVSWTQAGGPSWAGALRDVWGSSATDVFAVGLGGQILHFNGTAWTGLWPHGQPGVYCNGVWGSAPDNIIVVGSEHVYINTTSGQDGVILRGTR